MKKAFALFIVMTLCAGILLTASVSGKRSQPAAAQDSRATAPVQSNPEVQFGEHAITGKVKNMARGRDKGKHMVPDNGELGVDNAQQLVSDGVTKYARFAETLTDINGKPVGEVSGMNYSRGRNVHVTVYRVAQLKELN